MSRTSQRPGYLAIDAAARKRFADCAPAALRRRTPKYLQGLLLSMLHWLIVGSIGLLGLYAWGWSATALLIVFLAGIAVGIVADVLKWLFARQRVRKHFQDFVDDTFVWHMVMAMQKNAQRLPESATQTLLPGAAILMDLCFAAIAIAVFAMGFQALHFDAMRELQMDRSLQIALVAVVVAPLLSMMMTLLPGGALGDEEKVEIQAGGRGICLFVITLVFAFFSDSGDTARKLMIFINGATIFVGLLAALGVWVMTSEREWLRQYLAEKR